MIDTTCTKCQQPFQYEPVSSRKRHVCPGCLKANRKWHDQRTKKRELLLPLEEDGDHLFKSGLAAMSRDEIAWRMGISTDGVRHMERTALAKIRQHPEARKLFKFWKEEGSPTPGPQREAGEMLMEWQMELSRWRETSALWVENGLVEEATEAGDLIEKLQGKIREALESLKS